MRSPNNFFWIAASITDADTYNPNGIKTLLANGLSLFFNKSKPVLSNCSRSLSKYCPDCPILCNLQVFDNFTLAEELFSKAF